MKKSILILSNNLGGLYNFRKEVVSSLRTNGYEVVVSVPEFSHSDYFEGIDCRLVDTPFERKGMNPLKDVGLLFRYLRLIRKEKPLAVLSYTAKPNIYGGMACALTGTPQLANMTGLGSALENPGLLQKVMILLYRMGLRRTRVVFFQNKANEQFCLDNKIVRGRHVLIPGSGVNLDHHSLRAYPEKSPVRFLFLGRVMKEKGIDEYLAAARRLSRYERDADFHVVGPCEESYGALLKEMDDEGIIFYHGPQPDVRPYIEMCHCTVHPSYYPEGMSNVLLESCAAGRPVITTDRPGCGEILDDGVNGLLVRPRDPDDLAKKLEAFIALPYEKKVEMGRAARSKVEREFDRNIVVRAYLQEVEAIAVDKEKQA